MVSYGYIIVDIYEKFLGKDVYYLYAWTLYHILIPIWMFYFAFDHPMTWIVINPNNLHHTNNIMTEVFSYKSLFITIMWSGIIVALDLIFLMTIRSSFNLWTIKFKLPLSREIKKYKFLTDTNIFLIEIVVFVISFYSISLRDVMLFLSFNTIQITIIYALIKNTPFSLGRIFFTLAAYVFIFRLLIFPFETGQIDLELSNLISNETLSNQTLNNTINQTLNNTINQTVNLTK